MIGAVASVFLLAYADLRREQARALDDFTAEQATLARAYADAMRTRIDGFIRDLDLLNDLSSAELPAAALHRLLREQEAYLEVDVLDPGAPPLEMPTDGRQTLSSDPILQHERTSLLEHGNDERVSISAPLVRKSDGGRDERMRLFVRRRGSRAVVLLVDLDRLFIGVRAAASSTGAQTRWLVLDDAQRWVGFGPLGGTAGWQVETGPALNEVVALISTMAHGQEGSAIVSREAAESLGLGHRLAVAGYAPVSVRNGRPWSIAVVTSARRVRDRARLATWRLGAATGLAALLVVLFGVAIMRQQKRSIQLAEALNLAEATSALRERSEKMIEAIPIGVLALDPARRVTSANPYLAGRGVRADGRLSDAIPTATTDEIAALEALVLDACEQRKPVERSGLSLHLGEHGRRDIDAYGIPLSKPLPDVDCFLVLRDRTEMRALERNLQRAEKLATIGTLAAGVAHEIGTPLGIISGRAEQLLTRVANDESGETARKGITSILSQVDKVSTTIRQLLDFARIRPIDAQPVTPTQALQSAAALLEHHFRQAKVTLHVDASVSIPPVIADPGQLEQVLVNLLMNACDACAADGQVWVSASEHEGRVALEVCDDGVGIPPEHLSSVLDPFFTTKKRGQGTGLGLTIAADIVKNHGGTLEVESIVGEGTTIRVVLPRAAEVTT
jgi:signal transduction histidine kinase